MKWGRATRRLLAGAVAIAGLFLLLSLTGPNPDEEASGSVHRLGGACLTLQEWGLFGWTVVGETYTIADAQNGRWHIPTKPPPCQDVPVQTYLIRLPFDGPEGTYRICGLADDEPCVNVRRVPFDPGPPGP